MSILKPVAIVAAVCSFWSLSSCSWSQTFWGQFGKDSQHEAMTTNGVQDLRSILWQTAVDLHPVTNGPDVLAHYGSPLVTANTVVVNVRLGTVNGPNTSFASSTGFSSINPSNAFPSSDDVYRVEGHDLSTGTTLWSENTDYVDWMPHNWTPSYGSCIDSNGVVYSPGAGGTIWQYSNADSASGTFSRLCFYGLTNYSSNANLFNSNIQICTPISVDANNNIYFGFYVTGGWINNLSLASGIAKISSTGVGTWVSADTAVGGNTGYEVATNCAPAITADGNYVYVAMKEQGWQNYGNPTLVRLSTSNLSTANAVGLTSPAYYETYSGDPNTTTFPYIYDNSTSSPMIGPDGDVYYGVWWSDLEGRGFMLHYSADLSTVKIPGAFGWDDTASVVPASVMPNYRGTSSYLILTNYNNYATPGLTPHAGNGINAVAILDPNVAEEYTVQYSRADGVGPTYLTMQEVETVWGITGNGNVPGYREWCINSAVLDVAGKGAILNSEDGDCYRWDFASYTLTQQLALEPGPIEAYTPTVVSADGIAFTINNAELFAMWDGAKPTTVSASNIVAGNSEMGTVMLSSKASGTGATVQLSSDNADIQVPASVVVPAGSKSTTFPITSTTDDFGATANITATRYGFSASASVFAASSGLSYVTISTNYFYGGGGTAGAVVLLGNAPTSGRTVTLSCASPSIKFGATSAATPTSTLTLQFNGSSAEPFYVFVSPVASDELDMIEATLDDNTSLPADVSNRAPYLSAFTPSQSSVAGGSSDTASLVYSLSTGGSMPTAGMVASITYSAHTSGPPTVTSYATTSSFTFSSTSVASSVTENITATTNGGIKTISVTITPLALVGFGTSDSEPYMTHEIIGTVLLNGNTTASVPVTATSLDANSSIVTQPVIAAGAKSATFTIAANELNVNTNQTAKVSVKYGSVTITGSFTVRPIFLTSITTSQTYLLEGQTGQITLTISPYAGQLGVVVKLHSGSALLTVPATATIANNQTTVTVPITAAAHVSGVNRVSITATCAGDNSIALVTVAQ